MGNAAKKVLDYVTRRFNASSAGLKSRLGSLTFAEAPLSAISRFNWSSESTKARRLFEAPRQDDSSFRADLEVSTIKNRKNHVYGKINPDPYTYAKRTARRVAATPALRSHPVGPASRTRQAHACRLLEYPHLAVPCAHDTNVRRRFR